MEPSTRLLPLPRRASVALAARPWVTALVTYFCLTIAFWGWRVLGSLGSNIVAINDFDPSGFIWFYQWWPHALLHGQDPVFTKAILVPDGYNLAWATSVPGLSLALSPITLAFGPVVTFNVVALLAPTLAAFTAFLLCHHITRALWPSLLGGYLFGFSSYVVVELQGLQHLAFVAMLPVVVLLFVRLLDGSLGERRFLWTMPLALAAQFLVSTEVFVTMTLIGGLTILGAFALLRDWRARIVRAAALLAGAMGLTVVLLSPFLVLGLGHTHVSPDYAVNGAPADLLSWIVPNPDWQAIAFGTHGFAAGFGYLGVPLVLLAVLFGWELRRRRTALVALLGLAIACVASLGPRLRVGGHATGIPMPWELFNGLPLLRFAVPIRMAVFAFLAVAVIASMWLASRGGVARWALGLLAVVFLLPNVVGSTVWKIDVTDPSFFASGAYKRYLDPDDRVLVLPAAGENMRWQADSNFDFKMVGGGWAAVPKGYSRQPIWWRLALGTATPADADAFRRFVHNRGTTAVVLDPNHPTLPPSYRTLVDSLGVQGREIGGIVFYRLAPPPSRQRTSVPITRAPSSVVSFLPSAKLRAR